MSVENKGFWSVLYEITDLQQRKERFNSGNKTVSYCFDPEIKAHSTVPESVKDDGALVKFIARVEQLSGND